MEPFSVHLFGLINSMKYYKVKFLLDYIQGKNPKMISQCVSEALVETEWEEFVNLQKRKLGGEVWAFCDSAMVFINKEFLGGCENFHYWCKNELLLQIPKYPDSLMSEAILEMKNQLKARNHPFVYLDVSVSNVCLGSLVFELYADIVPKTCKNFITLCTGERGKSSVMPDCLLWYKNSSFHRIVPGGWIQGGDIYSGNGDGGESIYGQRFEDENYRVCHNRRGILGMANNGKHSNNSQFYITLGPALWMDTKFVAFGQLVFGYKILQVLEELETYNERPIKQTAISECGKFDIDAMHLIEATKTDTAVYLPEPKDIPDIKIKICLPFTAFMP
uniref:Peptidyl-prolyl cis-trans isomerase n=1 Tax=Hemiscolopendra marginata TaxID=943146 RepID=A0A646QGI5_9MYRI